MFLLLTLCERPEGNTKEVVVWGFCSLWREGLSWNHGNRKRNSEAIGSQRLRNVWVANLHYNKIQPRINGEDRYTMAQLHRLFGFGWIKVVLLVQVKLLLQCGSLRRGLTHSSSKLCVIQGHRSWTSVLAEPSTAQQSLAYHSIVGSGRSQTVLFSKAQYSGIYVAHYSGIRAAHHRAVQQSSERQSIAEASLT